MLRFSTAVKRSSLPFTTSECLNAVSVKASVSDGRLIPGDVTRAPPASTGRQQLSYAGDVDLGRMASSSINRLGTSPRSDRPEVEPDHVTGDKNGQYTMNDAATSAAEAWFVKAAAFNLHFSTYFIDNRLTSIYPPRLVHFPTQRHQRF